MKWREVMIYLLFVVLASLIWYGRSLRAEHDITVPVKVQYVGVPGQVKTSEPLPQTIQVTVRDAGMRLRVYHQKPLQITLDLTGRFTGKSGEIQVSSDLLRTTIARQLQGTTALQKVSPDQIHTTYYTQQERRLPVRLQSRIDCAPGFQMSGLPQLSETEVIAYGTANALDTLREIQTQVLAVQSLSDSAQYTVGLIVPREVRLSQTTVRVRVVAERFSERVVDLNLRAEGIPEGKQLHLFPQQVRATMRVGVSHWAQVEDGDIEAVCVYSDSLEQLPVELRTQNPYISGLRATPNHVEFILENIE